MSTDKAATTEEKLKQEALQQGDVTQIMELSRQYAKPVGIALAIVIVFSIGSQMIKSSKAKNESKAAIALMQAETPAAFQAVIDDFSGTKSAPIATLSLAKSYFNEGKYSEAEALYATLAKKYTGQEIGNIAELGLIAYKESTGSTEEAANAYAAFANANRGSQLAFEALISQARCLESLNKYSEAKAIYEDIKVNDEAQSWQNTAEINLQAIQSKL